VYTKRTGTTITQKDNSSPRKVVISTILLLGLLVRRIGSVRARATTR
jgi:hypothetical protein